MNLLPGPWYKSPGSLFYGASSTTYLADIYDIGQAQIDRDPNQGTCWGKLRVDLRGASRTCRVDEGRSFGQNQAAQGRSQVEVREASHQAFKMGTASWKCTLQTDHLQSVFRYA